MQNLKQFRTQCGLTQTNLAEKLGVSRTTVTMWENHKSEPDNEMLVRIANILQTTVDNLLGVEKQEVSDVLLRDERVNRSSGTSQMNVINALAEKLNSQGLERLQQYADDLVSSGKYEKLNYLSNVAARDGNGGEVTITEKQADELLRQLEKAPKKKDF